LRTREARPIDFHRGIAATDPGVAAGRGAIEALIAKEGILKGAGVEGIAAGDARARVAGTSARPRLPCGVGVRFGLDVARGIERAGVRRVVGDVIRRSIARVCLASSVAPVPTTTNTTSPRLS